MIDIISTIMFDFDGVIKESVDIKTKAFAQIFEKYGQEVVTEVITHHLENGGMSRFEKLKYYYNVLLKKPLSLCELDELSSVFSSLVKEKVIDSPYVNGAMEFIEKFYSQYTMFVVTGTPTSEIREILSACQIDLFFKSSYGSPEKKELIIEGLLEKYKLNPNEVLFVGDSLTDYYAAQSNTIHFVGIGDRSIKMFGQCINITDLTELEFAIKEINNGRG